MIAVPKFKPPKWRQRNRARLLFAQGLTDVAIARQVRVSPSSVGRWRRAEGIGPTDRAATPRPAASTARAARRASGRPRPSTAAQAGNGWGMLAALISAKTPQIISPAAAPEVTGDGVAVAPLSSPAASVVLLLGGCGHQVRGLPEQTSAFCPRCGGVERDVWRRLAPGERPF